MKYIVLLISIVSLAFALKGGVYNTCHGDSWHSSPQGGKPGKVCVHCNNGDQVKMFTKYASGGRMNFYDLNWNFIANGSHTGPAIQKVCK